MSGSADRDRVRRTARQIGLWTGVASAVVIAAGVGILVAVILATSRPQGDDRGAVGPGPGAFAVGNPDHIVVDVDRVVPWVIVLGAAGVALLGLIAWLTARRAVAPLEVALRAQRDFVADASHELRTPLTALSSRVQILQRRVARGERIDDALERLRGDTAAMDDILTELLLAAQADQGPVPAAASDAAVAVQTAVELIRPIAEGAGVELRPDVGPGIRVAVPEVTLTRLCTALLDNAVQHAPRGTPVAIVVAAGGGAARGLAEFRVVDRGPGVRIEDRERIFTRFARGPETGRRRGFGLGLALVRDVATRYGGSVGIESTSEAGATFLLRLPLALG
ncbi:MAG: two-component sensor histidine kinase [Microbacterium sp. 14-71-5]|jgi:signal transduction histidine kinase|uniref:sensor histidine kinase n=1 Tax=Microbacterium sp. 13-71-7 TaxID=1970399 RepID=UPI000BC73930|nr:HAMP domain-containing sensor histidine kinase [Microbacterium sp. 13-71-7]OZB80170.1 MAG: two-component sensor histidine kinase [Microbacterium sp. 14-71-5]OZB82190.1 MAG: two-component sensor histidine kinase [Microbacterium sp. 13-71-7]